MRQKVWETFTNQKQWEFYIKNLVKTNDRALVKAILLIYDLQTEEEKNTGQSVEENKIGFNKIDAYELGNIAKKIKRGQSLTKLEVAKSRNKMQKYWKQLMIISKRQMKKVEDAKLNEELAIIQEEQNEKLESFREHNEILRKCSEEGILCSYGICDECLLTTGFQMRLNLYGWDKQEG